MPKLTALVLLSLSPLAVMGYDVTIASYQQKIGFGKFGHPCPFRDGSGFTAAEYQVAPHLHEIGIYNGSTLLATITGGSSGPQDDMNLFGYTNGTADKGLPEINFETNTMALEVSSPNAVGCANNTVGAGWGYDIWVLAYNPGTMALSHGTNVTTIMSCAQGALHPRFTPKDDTLFFGQMYCNPPTYAGCMANEISYCTYPPNAGACGFGLWGLSTAAMSGSTPTLPATLIRMWQMTGLTAGSMDVVGWVEPCAAGGTFSSTPSLNTENGWLFFTESGDTSGQVYFNPKIAALNPSTTQFAVLVGQTGQWTEHCGITPDGTTLTYSTTLGNGNWNNLAGAFTTLDMSSASIRYQSGTVGLTNGRRLTRRNLAGYPESYTVCNPLPGHACPISAGKQEFFSPTAAAPTAPPVQDSLLINPSGDFAWGPTTFAVRDHLLQGRVTVSGKVSLK